MKFSDLAIGAVLILLGAGVLAYGLTLPPMFGQRYGAGLFPILLGCCLSGFGTRFAWTGWQERRTQGTPLASLGDWARDSRLVGNMLLVLALIVVYVVLSQRIGFILLSLAILIILFWRLGLPLLRAVVIAAISTLFIQLSFANLLRVPLPRGLLDRVLW
jgi:putative tricarboxylic transport membrane protein